MSSGSCEWWFVLGCWCECGELWELWSSQLYSCSWAALNFSASLTKCDIYAARDSPNSRSTWAVLRNFPSSTDLTCFSSYGERGVARLWLKQKWTGVCLVNCIASEAFLYHLTLSTLIQCQTVRSVLVASEAFLRLTTLSKLIHFQTSHSVFVWCVVGLEANRSCVLFSGPRLVPDTWSICDYCGIW